MEQIFSSTGNMLYYGGILGAGIGIILLIMCIPVSAMRRKSLRKKIEKELSEKR